MNRNPNNINQYQKSHNKIKNNRLKYSGIRKQNNAYTPPRKLRKLNSTNLQRFNQNNTQFRTNNAASVSSSQSSNSSSNHKYRKKHKNKIYNIVYANDGHRYNEYDNRPYYDTYNLYNPYYWWYLNSPYMDPRNSQLINDTASYNSDITSENTLSNISDDSAESIIETLNKTNETNATTNRKINGLIIGVSLIVVIGLVYHFTKK